MHILALALALAVAPARADDPDEISGQDFEEVADRLALTDAQRAKVTDLVYASHAAKIELKARAEKAQLELKRLMTAEPLDEKAILKAVDTLNAAEGDLRRNKVQLVLQLRKELTAEQWAQLVQIRRDRMRERREDRREDREEHDE